MNSKFLEVEQLVLALPVCEQRALVERLLDSLTDASESDVEAAWMSEALHRWESYQSGACTDTPADDVFARLNSRYQ